MARERSAMWLEPHEAPPGFAEMVAHETSRAARAIMVQRLLLFPFTVGITLWAWNDLGRSTPRLIAICVLMTLIATYLVTVLLVSRRGLTTRTLGLTAGLIAIGLCSVTGGLAGPFAVFLPLSVSAAAMGGPLPEAWIVLALELAALPPLAFAGATRPVFDAGALAFAMLMGLGAGRTIRLMFDRMVVRAMRGQEEVLRAHHEQLQGLTALSGEIARALKAPLASIGNLTQQAQQELGDRARAAERLHAARAETMRMQKLLDEFLNFSRPLSPLSIDTIDGMRLGAEAVELFQGLAHERRVSIALGGAPVELRCDRRKIKQLLINLVQNAVEASAAGGEIEVRVEPGDGEAAIRVLDRGRGLDSGLALRVFEPGVTTKPRGPGIGLTIAKSIAEQHGGTLSLRAREGGGCAAELKLPKAAAESRAA